MTRRIALKPQAIVRRVARDKQQPAGEQDEQLNAEMGGERRRMEGPR